MKTAAMTTMIAGPRTVVWGCFSPVQRLDELSEASVLPFIILAPLGMVGVDNTLYVCTPISYFRIGIMTSNDQSRQDGVFIWVRCGSYEQSRGWNGQSLERGSRLCSLVLEQHHVDQSCSTTVPIFDGTISFPLQYGIPLLP
jgi:hypothetical protein